MMSQLQSNLFPCAAFTDWFFYLEQIVFSVKYEVNLYILFTLI